MAYIYKRLKKGGKEDVEEAIQFMDDLNISNDHLKEHFMSLIMDKK